jgi:hypothetical protein
MEYPLFILIKELGKCGYFRFYFNLYSCPIIFLVFEFNDRRVKNSKLKIKKGEDTMDNLNLLLTKEEIERRRNELLEKNPELKQKYEEWKRQQVENVGTQQLEPQQELPNCLEVPCPINRFTTAVCCFTTPENIELTQGFTGDVTFDPTNITCQAEPFCVADVGPIDTSCGPVNGSCQVEVFAIRATGKLPFVVSFPVSNETVCPQNLRFSNICCKGFACLDNIVCLSCNPDACPDFCLTDAFAFVVAGIGDNCGSTAWLVVVDFFLPGC